MDLSVNWLETPLTTKLIDDEVKAFIDSSFISTLPCSTNEVKRTHSATSIGPAGLPTYRAIVLINPATAAILTNSNLTCLESCLLKAI